MTTSELLRRSLELGCEFLGMPIGIISRIQGDDYEVLVQTSPGEALADGQHFELGQTYCQLTLQSDDVLAIAVMQESSYASHPCYEAFKLESYIGVPIVVDGQRYGTLNFSSPDPRASRSFSEADVDFVRLLGRWVATTLRQWHRRRPTAGEAADALRYREGAVDVHRECRQGICLRGSAAGHPRR